jgi:D-sedoheptulose 7-phosphate isomerase
MEPTFKKNLKDHISIINNLSELDSKIENTAKIILKSVIDGGTIFWCGNGGSAADCQHYATELMVKYSRKRAPISSIALTTDTSLITAHSNDFDFKTVFSRQVEALVKPKDVFVGISTSGNSENVFLALKKASEIGACTVSILGNNGGKIKEISQNPIIVPSNITARIQEAHLLIGHFLCDFLEYNLGDSS